MVFGGGLFVMAVSYNRVETCFMARPQNKKSSERRPFAGATRAGLGR